MLRSLFSGISGLANHLTMLDVVGSNIANVNTIGFKSSRVTFREVLTQTVRGATRPQGGSLGGTNPAQIGLGSVVQSIDPTFSQGNLQNTGKITDLAIEGAGFFVVSDGTSDFFTRAGTFTFDGLGQLVSSGTGFSVQGIMADDDGSIDYGQPLENIRLGNDLVTPAQATETLKLTGNLNADADAEGTILNTGAFLAVARGSDTMTQLYSTAGQSLGIRDGDNLVVSFKTGGVTYPPPPATTLSFSIGATTTIPDIIAQLDAITPDADFSFNAATGQIEVTATAGDITDMQFEISGRTSFNSVASFSGTIQAATTATTENLRGAARDTDLLDNLYNKKGTKLAFADGDQFLISGTTGAGSVTSTLAFATGATTLGDIASSMQSAFGITNTTGVHVNAEGAIVIEGDPGLENKITQVDVQYAAASGVNTDFTTNFEPKEVRAARDAATWKTTATVFDSLGRDFRVSVEFTKRTDTNLWDWTAETPPGTDIVQGGAGTIGFGPNGLLNSFDYTDASGALQIDPGGGANILSIDLDPGTFGALNGLLQFEGSSTAKGKDFDGHGAGTLQGITINKAGILVGQFTNGINRSLAQIALAEFNNPSGLLRAGNNMYGTSSNTGPESITFVGQNATGSLAPGTLEMSNVDLSTEFTQMIIAQRGFQANARVISTGDEMLSELVTLKR